MHSKVFHFTDSCNMNLARKLTAQRSPIAGRNKVGRYVIKILLVHSQLSETIESGEKKTTSEVT